MKLLFKTIFLLLVLALISGGIFLLMFDLDKYRGQITTELSKALNRPVLIEKMSMKVSMVPTIIISGLTVKNQKESDLKEPLAQVGTTELIIELKPLLNKEIKIKKIALEDIVINLDEVLSKTEQETKDKTQADTKDDTKEDVKEDVKDDAKDDAKKTTVSFDGLTTLLKNPYLSNLQVDLISLSNAKINYRINGKKDQIEVKNATIRLLRIISADILYHNKSIQMSFNTNLMNILKAPNDFIFNMYLNAFDSSLKISGNLGDLKEVKEVLLNIDFSANNLTTTLRGIGLVTDTQIPNTTLSASIKGDFDQMNVQRLNLEIEEGLFVKLTGKMEQMTTKPQGNLDGYITIKDSPFTSNFGLKPMTIETNATLKDHILAISKLLLNANRSDVDATLKITQKENKLSVDGTVESNYFDISDFYEEPISENKINTNALSSKVQKKSDSKLNSTWLNTLDSQISWKFKNIKPIDSMEEYYGIDGRSTLSNGELTITPLHIKAEAGIINALVRLQNLTEKPLIQISFSGDNMNMDKIKEIRTYISGSTANLSGTLTTTGLNKQDILSHLNGTVEVEMTQGKIINKWFNNLPQEIGLIAKSKPITYSQTDTESTLNCAAARLSFNNGLVNINKSLAIETSTLDVVLDGEINLPKETLSLTLDPSLPNKPQNKMLSAAQAIRIEGPINNPSMKLDTKKIISTGIEKGINKLMEKAGLLETTEEITQSVDTNQENTRQPLSLCETALGHKMKGKPAIELISKQKSLPAISVTPTQAKDEKLTPQEILKKQLIKSLSSAVQ